MRKSLLIGVGALMLIGVAPAKAQFAAPFGAPGILTTPEFPSGAIGAGAANSAATQQQCVNVGGGRDGPRYQCAPVGAPQQNRR